MRKWKLIVIISSLLLAFIIFIITREAVLETQNWKFLDLDYSGKGDVISSYGALLAAILSSVSIFLLVYTILFQSQESIAQANRFSTESEKQEKRFMKEHKLQKKHFKLEKQREESKRRRNLYFKLELISEFLKTIVNHVQETGDELKKFIELEKANPLGMNMLFFLVNKNMGKLIEMDYLSIFIAFREFFAEEESWTKDFNSLFSLVGFNKDALDELRENFTYHKNDKYKRKLKISENLKTVMDMGFNIVDRYKDEYGKGYLDHPLSSLINRFVPAYYKILDADDEAKRETDLDKLSQGLLLKFNDDAMKIRDEFGLDNLGSKEMIALISSIRKDIYKLKFDSLYFAGNCEERYIDYFSRESNNIKELIEIKVKIERRIETINLNEL